MYCLYGLSSSGICCRVKIAYTTPVAIRLTIERKRAPTWSSPLPPSRRSPRASSSAWQNRSENTAISVILPKMSLTSSGVMGGAGSPAAATRPFVAGPRTAEIEESEAVETVREEEPDDDGSECGIAWPGQRQCAVWLERDDVPSASGMWTSRTSARSLAYARSEDRSSCSACCRFVSTGVDAPGSGSGRGLSAAREARAMAMLSGLGTGGGRRGERGGLAGGLAEGTRLRPGSAPTTSM